MINPDIFPILNASVPVKALLGANPLRVYPYGRAPQKPKQPYAVYSLYSGLPENYLDKRPDIDNKGTQIEVYAEDPLVLEQCFTAIINALEPHGHMTNFNTPDREQNTDLYGCLMEFDFWESR